MSRLDSLLISISLKNITNDTLKEPESSTVTTNVESVYIPTPTMRQKDVRDELAIVYAEEIVNLNFLPFKCFVSFPRTHGHFKAYLQL